MNDTISDFLDYIILEKGLTDNTRSSYTFDLECFNNYFRNMNIKDINKQDLLDYLKYLKETKKLSSRSIERHLTTLRGFYKYLKKMNIINEDITTNIDNLKLEKHLPSVLEPEEIDKLMDIKLNNPFNIRTKAMLELMYSSGLRVSELVNLTINDIDLYNNIIIVNGKGRKERIVPIGEIAKELFGEYFNIEFE